MTKNHITPAATLEHAVALAIETVLESHREETASITFVFSGEGTTAAEATRDALGDIAARCEDHRCSPVRVVVDGVMRTDEGYRVWGTMGCSAEDPMPMPTREIPEITMSKEEEGGWTLTISAE